MKTCSDCTNPLHCDSVGTCYLTAKLKVVYVAKFSVDYAKVLPSLKTLNEFLDMAEARVVSRAEMFETKLTVDRVLMPAELDIYKEALVKTIQESFGKYDVKLESFEREIKNES